MKKVIPLLFLLVFVNFTFAQKKPKIQGSKNVIETSNTLASFKAIELSEDIVVNIFQGEATRYTLKCDDNLVDFIKFEIVDETLKIYTTHEIRRAKALEINLTVLNISSITLKENSKLTCKTRLKLDTLSFTAFDESEYNIDVFAESSNFQLYKSTKGKIQLKGQNTKFTLIENAYIEGDIVLENIEIIAKDRTDVEVEGDVKFLKLTTSNSSDVDLKKLKCSTIEAITSDSSEAYIFSNGEMKLSNSDKSKVYIYGNPSISIDRLKDNAQIIKK
ncbi:hypothetical protein IMCC3317_11480 [Kordia antarctica]|uniref:Putative auto-transporter adhesin head GIN domain-containing protein n=1 Tax=Kordia antarctica TaxID=1218801 RepID=A0A7L4ZGZ4_9FLAO|nr:DUF2807 domain-containing protein [Kordia antarctica]QHI35800.1 hypothetical protein IMCC3317_11480 [Kordia antarctica]